MELLESDRTRAEAPGSSGNRRLRVRTDAGFTHARRGEYPNKAAKVALGAIALTIAIFRFGTRSF